MNIGPQRTVGDSIRGATVYLRHLDYQQALHVCQRGLQVDPANRELLQLAHAAAVALGDQDTAKQYASTLADLAVIDAARQAERAAKLKNAADGLATGAAVAGSTAATGAGIVTGAAGVAAAAGVGIAGAGLVAGGIALSPGCGCIVGIPMILLGCMALFAAVCLGLLSFGAAASLGAVGLGGLIALLTRGRK